MSLTSVFEDVNEIWMRMGELVEEMDHITNAVDYTHSRLIHCIPLPSQRTSGNPAASHQTEPYECIDTRGSSECLDNHLELVHSPRSMFNTSLRIRIHLCTINDLNSFLRGYINSCPSTIIPFSPPRLLRRLDFERFSSSESLHDSFNSDRMVPDRLSEEALINNPHARFLFQTYLSPKCFPNICHVNRDLMTEDFLCGKLEPAFLYSAIALAAQHVYSCHADAACREELLRVAESCFEEAKYSIREIFDEPTEATVLASYNLCMYLFEIFCVQEGYVYLGHAISMARQLDIDWDNASEQDPVRREGKRRLWWSLYASEVAYSLFARKTLSMYAPVNLEIYQPEPLPGEGEDDMDSLRFTIDLVEWYTLLLNIPPLDLSRPDRDILTTLSFICTSLGQYLPPSNENNLERLTTLTPLDLFFESIYWSAWGKIWLNLLDLKKSGLAPERLKTPVIRELLIIAMNECAQAARHISTILRESSRRDIGCSMVPIGSNIIACQIHRFVIFHHPNPKARFIALQHLAETNRILHSTPFSLRNCTRGQLKTFQGIYHNVRAKLNISVNS
ncbi:uncharacterized protein VTP21DRAFT_1526 [Calcarisporiella thermophila]|uniref:uncharacterized protein n=1 Tax=Calcarisporiella thermophila TaxID=911321 RepID=UPI0037429427